MQAVSRPYGGSWLVLLSVKGRESVKRRNWKEENLGSMHIHTEISRWNDRPCWSPSVSARPSFLLDAGRNNRKHEPNNINRELCGRSNKLCQFIVLQTYAAHPSFTPECIPIPFCLQNNKRCIWTLHKPFLLFQCFPSSNPSQSLHFELSGSHAKFRGYSRENILYSRKFDGVVDVMNDRWMEAPK